MRIAMIGHKRYGSREGGVEVVVTELARRMAALGHEVTCYDRAGRDVATGEALEARERFVDGVRVVPVRTVDARGLAALSSSFSATLAAIGDRPDVVHYHAEGPCVALGLASRAGLRTVATVHGLDWQRAKWGGPARTCIKLGERTAARRAGALIVLSRGVQGYFREEYGREALLVPNGVSPAEDMPAEIIRERWDLEKGSYVLFVGRIVPEKRAGLLLEAFAGLETDKRLVIAGGPSDSRAHFEEVAALAARDPRALMAGFVEGRALAELYSNACCYVLPSDLEGMPMSLLEAMSHGLPCVTSDVPECADVLGEAGLTFRRGDADSLRAKLDGLLTLPEAAARLGRLAREKALAEHGWDAVVERTLEIYERVREGVPAL